MEADEKLLTEAAVETFVFDRGIDILTCKFVQDHEQSLADVNVQHEAFQKVTHHRWRGG